MKSLIKYIQEKLIIKKNKYNYFPETKEELKAIIKQRIKDEGNEVDLNDIDVSKINDMSSLFDGTGFKNGFNGDISNWDVSNVTEMEGMFYSCKNFNQDRSSWDVSNVTNMNGMFYNCKSFNQDISAWDVSNVKDNIFIFDNCPIKEKYKPKFK